MRELIAEHFRLVREAASDRWLLAACLTLLGLGVVMVASASLNLAGQENGDPFYFTKRQVAFVGLGLVLAWIVAKVPVAFWARYANQFLVVCAVLLILVLIPGVGSVKNGSARWLSLGIFNLQVSELAKLALVVYFAAYLARKGAEIGASLKNLFLALLPLAGISVLLLAEPDLGATAVMGGTVLAMCFLAGVRLWYFGLLLGVAGAALTILIVAEPYRFERLVSFTRACEPEFYYNQGYQLCQALIAFGRGEWAGVGLGSGVQKLFYLPEAHTDFLLAILGEELGFVGSVFVIALFGVLIWRGFVIARKAHARGDTFAALLAFGVTIWLGLQAVVNMGVNMGLLPTKGITLPLMSYGGSSMVVTCVAVALLLRVAWESSPASETNARKGGKRWAHAS